jgi:hypothetical protein
VHYKSHSNREHPNYNSFDIVLVCPKRNINKTTRLHKQETNCKASLPQGKCEDLSWQYPKVNENKEDGCSIEVEVPRCERAWYENYKAIF